jgi:hypothetical protein
MLKNSVKLCRLRDDILNIEEIGWLHAPLCGHYPKWVFKTVIYALNSKLRIVPRQAFADYFSRRLKTSSLENADGAELCIQRLSKDSY